MKPLRSTLLIPLALLLATSFGSAQSGETGRTFADFPIYELNLARQQQLTGQQEEAILTYNGALARQADWVPALTARAVLLKRLGRSKEAQRDQQRASRLNPIATSFFMAKGHNDLMPFLALYPQAWYAENYGFPADSVDHDHALFPSGYFSEQQRKISGGPDTALAVQVLRKKVEQDVTGSRRSLGELNGDYNYGVQDMLEGNLAMLGHRYLDAAELYSDAIDRYGFAWPELYYNRGLANVLLYRYKPGCQDLSQAGQAGYLPARVMYDCLCAF